MSTSARKQPDRSVIEHLKKRIKTCLDQHKAQSFTTGKLIQKLNLGDRREKMALQTAVAELVRSKEIVEMSNGRLRSNQKAERIVGRVDFVNPRFAFIIPDGLDHTEDIYVRENDLMQALDDDLVEVEITGTNRSGRFEGRVVKLLERKRTQFVGRVVKTKATAFVRPDFKKMHLDIYVKMKDLKGAENDDKVVVELSHWPAWERNPEGVVVEVLGKSGEHEAEIHSIMAEFNLPFEFPKEIVQEAETLRTAITKEEIAKRRDFRGITTFTIDPEDAKDFDDALSVEHLPGGFYRIGVHIADVTHYVRPNTQLEREASRRATSVYLVDRTIPMLPEKLSNDLCSLRPNEDKLCFSAVFDMDEQGRIKEEWFGRTIIHSDRRFTYEEAQERLETGEGDFAEEILLLNKLAYKLREKRFAEGSLGFETVEVKFKLDEKGKPLGMFPKVRKDAHKLIEDFMLLANKRVAEYVYRIKKGHDKNTFVYRTHDNPDPEKLESFALFARRFGHKFDPLEENRLHDSLKNLIKNIEGKPEQNILENLAIRSMAKAKYTTAPKGHFALAFKHYTHFTSPIRRYPDMMVHRLLQHYLDGNPPPEREEYEAACQHSSLMEKNASDAERASIKYKQVEFMAMAEVKDYEGIITGVTEFGIFVEIIETRCEGMVRVSDLEDDYYDYDEKNLRLIGRRRGRIFNLGQQVVVRVIGTDINRRTIDLELVQNK
jgi:ribonuclease R